LKNPDTEKLRIYSRNIISIDRATLLNVIYYGIVD